ncbi:alpha-1,2-fucosyltransferase [Stieleria varia]|uniref:Glycosyl transferase family 11 n=1 Tax=Stieleria varia TaxID=2528005 RepID=A0A5C6A1V4_9BACT|nr:alpha-1,2-fucosyltransferase [Stieleria varia]TWT93211.1 Glycosyl transferase family 11 [Stieleria varia]
MHPPQIIIARSYGQLGNRLFLYGHMIAAARHYGAELLNPCFAEYARLFETTAGDLWCRYPVVTAEADSQDKPSPADAAQAPSTRSRRLLAQAIERSAKLLAATRWNSRGLGVLKLGRDVACDLADSTFEQKLRSHRRLLTHGWLFRSETLFRRHADEVRSHLRPAECHRQNIARCITHARADTDVLVGVHIRRGDYATFQNGQYFFDDECYRRWMHQCAEQFDGRRVTFLVCSNAPVDAEQFPGLNIVQGPGHLLEDMYTLAETDFMIGPPSTFTGWAAFMGGNALQYLQSKTDSVSVPDRIVRRRDHTLESAA